MESFLAVGCADNSIVVVNVATKSKVCTVAGLQVPYDRVVSLGVNKQGRAEVSLLMSSRGALQRYDLDQDCQVSKLSVSYNQDHAPYARSTGKRSQGQRRSAGANLIVVLRSSLRDDGRRHHSQQMREFSRSGEFQQEKSALRGVGVVVAA